MKKILLLLLAIPCFVFGQTTDATLTTQAQQIKNETVSGANTANRVGTHLQNLVYSKKSFFIDGTASGTNTYSVTLNNGAITSLSSQWFVVKFTNANTAASNLNINAIGAKNLVKTDGSALSSGDIDAGSVHLLSYDGTNLQVLSLGGAAGSSLTAGSGITVVGDSINWNGALTEDVIMNGVFGVDWGQTAALTRFRPQAQYMAITAIDSLNLSIGGTFGTPGYVLKTDGTKAEWGPDTGTGSVNTFAKNTQSGNYTLQQSDTVRTILMSSASNQTLTIPTGMKGGSIFMVLQDSANTVTLDASAVTVDENASGNLTLTKGYIATIFYKNSNRVVISKNSAVAGGGHIIADEGTAVAAKDTLDFIGGGVSVANVGDKTVVTIVSAEDIPFAVAASDQVTVIGTDTSRVEFMMTEARTLVAVYASLRVPQVSGSLFTVDVLEDNTSIFSTLLTMDNGEKDSRDATTPAVISDTSLADGSFIRVAVTQIGNGTAIGLILYFIWN